MNQLAKRAGVHVSTVSRALRGESSIPAQTRNRIHALAAEFGYRPDPLLSALCAYRKGLKGRPHTPTIAIIATTPNWKDDLANRLYCEGARERAHEQGFRTEVFVMNPTRLRGRRIAGILGARGIRGVLVLPLADVTLSAVFPWHDFLVVAMGYKLQLPNINRVSINHFAAMRDALLKVQDLGYERPGLILRADGPHLAPDGVTYVNKLWKGAYLAEASKLFPKLRIPVIQLVGARDLRRWLLRYKPDVLISQHRGIVGFLPPPYANLPIVYTMVDDDEKLTGIHQNSRYVGRHATNILTSGLQQEILQPEVAPVTILVEARWQAGTTAPPRTLKRSHEQ